MSAANNRVEMSKRKPEPCQGDCAGVVLRDAHKKSRPVRGRFFVGTGSRRDVRAVFREIMGKFLEGLGAELAAYSSL